MQRIDNQRQHTRSMSTRQHVNFFKNQTPSFPEPLSVYPYETITESLCWGTYAPRASL